MITTNLPDLVRQLSRLALVRVHDGVDSITVTLPASVDMQAVDELVCDALFVDPMSRVRNKEGWTLELFKRSKLRTASDLRAVPMGPVVQYELMQAA